MSIPEVVEFYRMSGETDYLLRIVVPDIAGLTRRKSPAVPSCT
jgi:Lrp/AsnC family transcriptional regulator